MSWDQQERAQRAVKAIGRRVDIHGAYPDADPTDAMARIIKIAGEYADDVAAHRESKS